MTPDELRDLAELLSNGDLPADPRDRVELALDLLRAAEEALGTTSYGTTVPYEHIVAAIEGLSDNA